MKRIIKNTPPAQFEQWKIDFRSGSEQPLETLYLSETMTGNKLWELFPSAKLADENKIDGFFDYSKEELRTELLKEQGYICCYCNQKIQDSDTVLEHFKPKGLYLHLTFDYQNILASCQGEQKKPKPREVHCDARRLEGEELPFSPLDTDCERHFDFTIDGQILPLSPQAETFVNKLGLDITKLDDIRASYIKDYVYENPFSKEFVSVDKAKQKIEELKQMQHASFVPFCIAIIKVLEREILNI